MSKSSDRYLVLITKIIFFYSVFYVIMKAIAMVQGPWVVPHLILSLPYLVFALLGGLIVKNDKYTWVYVIAGVILISVVRYYELEWMLMLQEKIA